MYKVTFLGTTRTEFPHSRAPVSLFSIRWEQLHNLSLKNFTSHTAVVLRTLGGFCDLIHKSTRVMSITFLFLFVKPITTRSNVFLALCQNRVLR